MNEKDLKRATDILLNMAYQMERNDDGNRRNDTTQLVHNLKLLGMNLRSVAKGRMPIEKVRGDIPRILKELDSAYFCYGDKVVGKDLNELRKIVKSLL